MNCYNSSDPEREMVTTGRDSQCARMGSDYSEAMSKTWRKTRKAVKLTLGPALTTDSEPKGCGFIHLNLVEIDLVLQIREAWRCS